MQLALTLALLTATSSAIHMSKCDDSALTNEDDNCGHSDEWEDCREDANLGSTEEEYKECIDDLDQHFWDECGGDDAPDFDCYEPHLARY